MLPEMDWLAEIADVTGIDISCLTNPALLDGLSLAQKMSWASKRKCNEARG